MKLPPFKLERYFAVHEFSAPYLLCCSDCESMRVGDLLDMEPSAEKAFFDLQLGYTESRGHPQLREQIASLYTGVDPEEVLVHSGAEEAIFNTMQVLLDSDSHAIVHWPCYQSLMEVAGATGCAVSPWPALPENGWALDIEDLNRSLRPNTRLVVINCPHNPTGYLMRRQEVEELVNLSRRHGFVIFSDEVYRLLEHDPADRLPALCELDETAVSLGVMSKAFGLAGLRIGWTVTRNRSLYEKLATFKDYTTICNSAPAEYLATIALKHREAILGRNLDIISKNLTLLDKFFDRYPGLFHWQKPRAGPIAFPRFLGPDTVQFCSELLDRAGVLLLPGTLYDDGLEHYFRIGFGRKNLPQGLQALERHLEKGNRT